MSTTDESVSVSHECGHRGFAGGDGCTRMLNHKGPHMYGLAGDVENYVEDADRPPPPTVVRSSYGFDEARHRQFAQSAVPVPENDAVNHPPHYNSHPSGIEAIVICEGMNFNLGSAVKYLFRAGVKTPNPIEDLRKCAWYVNREIERLEKQK